MECTLFLADALAHAEGLRGRRFAQTLAAVSILLGDERRAWRRDFLEAGISLGDLKHPFIDLDDKRMAELFVSICNEGGVLEIMSLFVTLLDISAEDALICLDRGKGNAFLRGIVKKGLYWLLDEMFCIGDGVLLHVSDGFLSQLPFLTQYCDNHEVFGFYRILTEDARTTFALYGRDNLMTSGPLSIEDADRVVRLYASGLFDRGEVKGVHQMTFPKVLRRRVDGKKGSYKRPHLRRPHVRHLGDRKILIPWVGVHLKLGNFGIDASLRYAERHNLVYTEVGHE